MRFSLNWWFSTSSNENISHSYLNCSWPLYNASALYPCTYSTRNLFHTAFATLHSPRLSQTSIRSLHLTGLSWPTHLVFHTIPQKPWPTSHAQFPHHWAIANTTYISIWIAPPQGPLWLPSLLWTRININSSVFLDTSSHSLTPSSCSSFLTFIISTSTFLNLSKLSHLHIVQSVSLTYAPLHTLL